MKTLLAVLTILVSFSASANWAEKYQPTSPLSFKCTVETWVGDTIPFTITFEEPDYSGSNGGYFYTKVSRVGLSGLFEGEEKTFKLFAASDFMQGAYTFEDGFQVKLVGEKLLDGNIDNNLYLSKKLKTYIYRGSNGKCVRVSP